MITAISVIYISHKNDLSQTSTAVPSISEKNSGSTASPINNNEVIITKTGLKYHLPICQYVENKNNTEIITVEKAVQKGLVPCKICKP